MNNETTHATTNEALIEALDEIRTFMERELGLKNESLRRQSEAIESLISQRDDYKKKATLMQEELLKAREIAEGKRQLVDKLLGDIARLQQDVDWYKRTYEERSFWGTVLEKLFRKR